MTREEAIQHFKEQLDIFGGEHAEAIEMAIEALERERTDEWCTDCKEYDTEKKCCPRFNRVIRGAMKREPSEDLISRTEAIEAMKAVSDSICEQQAVDALDAIPSADRPRGEWIETAQDYYETVKKKGGGVNENTEYFTDDIACSECLTKFSNIDNETERFNFCPNCGADMRSE